MIINVSSGLAQGLIPPFSVYGASKAFVSHFTELLHEEVGSKGIRLQCLVPGLTRTNLGNAETTGVFDRFPDSTIMTPESIVDASLASLSMGELHCITLLHDPAQWVETSHAMHAIGALPLSREIPPRYRAIRGVTWRSVLQP
jgi:short-subunit dehydrogenase